MRVITIDADTNERVYTRKEVADLVGVSTQTIRLWEDAGVIPPSVRDDNGYRYLDENNQLKVDFILEHLQQVEIYPDRVVVMIPLFSEGMVVYKTQYVSGEKRRRKNNPY